MEKTESSEFVIEELIDSVTAQQSARRFSANIGFDLAAREEITLATAEIASNLLKHAGKGVLALRRIERGGRVGVEIDSEDHGPGIRDVEQSFADGYSTQGSLGYGLGTVNRLMDEVDISSTPDSGTKIACRRWLREKTETAATRIWDVGVLSRPCRAGPENGDAFVVKGYEGCLLVGLIDGLGHGALAQKAALAAQNYVQRHDHLSLDRIFVGTSRACQGTRGAVMALAHFSSIKQLAFASIGNVEARVCGSAERVPLAVQRGILGMGEAHITLQSVAWDRRWILILHTDGLRTRWQWEDFPNLGHEPAKTIAAELMKSLASGNDDATVLVVKC